MSLTVTPAMRALLQQQAHRFAKVHRITRPDGTVLRFTDHNGTITYQGEDYTPSGGGSLSAQRRIAQLEDANADFVGVLTSPAITYNDLHAGRYREAVVISTLVDWRYPWAGQYFKTKYWITETKYDGEQWTGSLSTLPGWMRFDVGDVHGRTCELTLYSARCGVSQGAFAASTDSAEVTTIDIPRRKFQVTSWDNGQTDDYFNGGHLIWYTGANAGVKSQIKSYESSGPRRVELELNTPFDIVDGDTFNAWRGCNKLGRTGDCKLIFDNMVNNLGYGDMPGTDKMLASPTR